MHQVQSTKGQLHCSSSARRQHFHSRQEPPHLYSRARHHQHPSHQEGNQVYSTEKHLYPCYGNHWQSTARKYHQWTSAFSPCTSQLSESCQQIQTTLSAKRSSEFWLWNRWRSSVKGFLPQGYHCWWSTSCPVCYRQHDSASLLCQKLVYWCNIQGVHASLHTATQNWCFHHIRGQHKASTSSLYHNVWKKQTRLQEGTESSDKTSSFNQGRDHHHRFWGSYVESYSQNTTNSADLWLLLSLGSLGMEKGRQHPPKGSNWWKAFDLNVFKFYQNFRTLCPLGAMHQWLWSPSPVASSPVSGSWGISLERLGQNCIRLKWLHTWYSV